MVTLCPATVSVVVRATPDVFAVVEYVIVPELVPDAPVVIVSQLALLVAVHAQPLPVVSATVPVVPLTGLLALVGETTNAHWLTNSNRPTPFWPAPPLPPPLAPPPPPPPPPYP